MNNEKTTLYSDEDMLSEDLFINVNHTTIPWVGGTYTGQIKDGKPNGQGEIHMPDNTVYVGEWEDGKPNGYGKIKYSSDGTYVGEFYTGKRHGQKKNTHTPMAE